MNHLGIAIETAKKAGAFLIDKNTQISTKTSKGKNDWVTDIDIQVEKMIKNNLQKYFPKYGFNGEESKKVNSRSKYQWVVDPIDSTDNFIRHLPHYTITIALLHDNKPVVGIIYDPLTDKLFCAQKNKGAFCNEKPIHVSETDNLSEALFFSVPGNREDDNLDEGVRIYEKLLLLRTSMKSWGSVALEIAYVASGNADAAVYIFSDPYSMPAAKIILEEAGGIMTNMRGKSWNQKSTTTLASNKRLHNKLIEYLK
ncbi:MAG: inositol monophosphatase family protein [Patescibacteria group bacterium]